MQNVSQYIAFNRFGYGATPSLSSAVIDTPQEWLIKQLQPYEIKHNNWNSEIALRHIFSYQKEKKAVSKAKDPVKAQEKLTDLRKSAQNQSKKLTHDIIQQAITTTLPLQARLHDFFANHFSVSNTNSYMRALSPTLECEAIAPHLTGSFADMLVAVTQHPAMLYYLNNESSIGPNSKIGLRRKKRGLNENLGREILELHTLGVNADYTQKDVQSLSKALTGWTIGGKKPNEPLGFLFKKNAHEPGNKALLGKTYPAAKNNTHEQAENMLVDLALHEETAKHVSYKLAKHFISDQPPADLVNKMSARWLSTKGHIPSVMKVMIAHPLSWSTKAQKFKTPREFLISICRACQLEATKPNFVKTLVILGQAPYASGSPAGFGDSTQDWASASAMMNRIEWAEHIAGQVNTMPLDAAKIALGNLISPLTAAQIRRAESKRQSLALLFMSPEFLRR